MEKTNRMGGKYDSAALWLARFREWSFVLTPEFSSKLVTCLIHEQIKALWIKKGLYGGNPLAKDRSWNKNQMGEIWDLLGVTQKWIFSCWRTLVGVRTLDRSSNGLLYMGGSVMPVFFCRPTHSVSQEMVAKDWSVFPSPTSSAIRIPGIDLLDFLDRRRRRMAWTPAI